MFAFILWRGNFNYLYTVTGETVKAGEKAASEMVAEGKKAIEKANEVMDALEKELKNQQEKSESSAYSYRK